MNSDPIISSLLTTDDRDDVKTHVDTMLSLVYTNQDSLISYIHTQIPFSTAGSFLQSLQNLPDTDSKEKWLKEIQEVLSSFETIHLVLPFDPPRSSLERISQVVAKKYGKKLLMRIQYNPDLIAGVEIVYQGAYRDLSARTRFTEVMETLKSKAI